MLAWFPRCLLGFNIGLIPVLFVIWRPSLFFFLRSTVFHLSIGWQHEWDLLFCYMNGLLLSETPPIIFGLEWTGIWSCHLVWQVLQQLKLISRSLLYPSADFDGRVLLCRGSALRGVALCAGRRDIEEVLFVKFALPTLSGYQVPTNTNYLFWKAWHLRLLWFSLVYFLEKKCLNLKGPLIC